MTAETDPILWFLSQIFRANKKFFLMLLLILETYSAQSDIESFTCPIEYDQHLIHEMNMAVEENSVQDIVQLGEEFIQKDFNSNPLDSYQSCFALFHFYFYQFSNFHEQTSKERITTSNHQEFKKTLDFGVQFLQFNDALRKHYQSSSVKTKALQIGLQTKEKFSKTNQIKQLKAIKTDQEPDILYYAIILLEFYGEHQEITSASYVLKNLKFFGSLSLPDKKEILELTAKYNLPNIAINTYHTDIELEARNALKNGRRVQAVQLYEFLLEYNIKSSIINKLLNFPEKDLFNWFFGKKLKNGRIKHIEQTVLSETISNSKTILNFIKEQNNTFKKLAIKEQVLDDLQKYLTIFTGPDNLLNQYSIKIRKYLFLSLCCKAVEKWNIKADDNQFLEDLSRYYIELILEELEQQGIQNLQEYIFEMLEQLFPNKLDLDSTIDAVRLVMYIYGAVFLVDLLFEIMSPNNQTIVADKLQDLLKNFDETIAVTPKDHAKNKFDKNRKRVVYHFSLTFPQSKIEQLQSVFNSISKNNNIYNFDEKTNILAVTFPLQWQTKDLHFSAQEINQKLEVEKKQLENDKVKKSFIKLRKQLKAKETELETITLFPINTDDQEEINYDNALNIARKKLLSINHFIERNETTYDYLQFKDEIEKHEQQLQSLDFKELKEKYKEIREGIQKSYEKVSPFVTNFIMKSERINFQTKINEAKDFFRQLPESYQKQCKDKIEEYENSLTTFNLEQFKSNRKSLFELISEIKKLCRDNQSKKEMNNNTDLKTEVVEQENPKTSPRINRVPSLFFSATEEKNGFEIVSQSHTPRSTFVVRPNEEMLKRIHTDLRVKVLFDCVTIFKNRSHTIEQKVLQSGQCYMVFKMSHALAQLSNPHSKNAFFKEWINDSKKFYEIRNHIMHDFAVSNLRDKDKFLAMNRTQQWIHNHIERLQHFFNVVTQSDELSSLLVEQMPPFEFPQKFKFDVKSDIFEQLSQSLQTLQELALIARKKEQSKQYLSDHMLHAAMRFHVAYIGQRLLDLKTLECEIYNDLCSRFPPQLIRDKSTEYEFYRDKIAHEFSFDDTKEKHFYLDEQNKSYFYDEIPVLKLLELASNTGLVLEAVKTIYTNDTNASCKEFRK